MIEQAWVPSNPWLTHAEARSNASSNPLFSMSHRCEPVLPAPVVNRPPPTPPLARVSATKMLYLPRRPTTKASTRADPENSRLRTHFIIINKLIITKEVAQIKFKLAGFWGFGYLGLLGFGVRQSLNDAKYPTPRPP